MFAVTTIVVLASSGILTNISRAESNPLPAYKQALSWLPADTETLFMARDFIVSRSGSVLQEAASGQKIDSLVDVREIIRLEALSTLCDLEKGAEIRPFAGHKIVLALRGARHADVVSSFGSIRDEGCSIIFLEKPVNEIAPQWSERSQRNALEVRVHSGKKIYVFPTSVTMEPWVKLKSWQGTFIVLLKPDVLLCASSDQYLKEVLDRIDVPQTDRAMSDQLPIWKYTDPALSTWMIRRCPNREMIESLAFLPKQNEFQVVYLPAAGRRSDAESRIRADWSMSSSTSTPGFRAEEDGSIRVTGTTSVDFIWQILRLPAEQGN
jgi:hypothetical protein